MNKIIENSIHEEILRIRSKEKMLSRTEAAHFLGVQKNTLAVWACTKRYKLPMYKVGRHIKYKLTDLQKFVSENIIL